MPDRGHGARNRPFPLRARNGLPGRNSLARFGSIESYHGHGGRPEAGRRHVHRPPPAVVPRGLLSCNSLGTFDGPGDLSTNPKHMEGFGGPRYGTDSD